MKRWVMGCGLWVVLVMLAANLCYAEDNSAEQESWGGAFDYICKMRDEFGVKSDRILGKNRRVFAGGSLSDDSYSVKVCLEQRQFPDEGMTAGIEAQSALLDDKRYRQATELGGVYLYAEAGGHTKFSTEFKYSQPDIYHLSDTADAAVRKYKGENQVNLLLFRCEDEPVDNEDYPKKGRKTDLGFEVSSKAIGSDFEFLRTKVQNAFYYSPRKWIFMEAPLNEIVFVLNGHAGFMSRFGGEDEIPFFERFYAGGTGTVRGYRSRYLAPKDNEGLPIGGNCMAVLNLEMRYPVYKDIKGAIFYDQGNAWEHVDDLDLTDTKAGIGTGLRWVTPLGTARLDYGYGLNAGSRQRGGRVHLSLGMKF